jgi:phosphoribosylaminoimidazole-succinocarboxamide synthase
MGKPGQVVPEMTDEVCDSISKRYIELYQTITGEEFVPADNTNLASRIENNIADCLKTL